MRVKLVLGAVLAALSIGGAQARAGCVLGKVAELPVTMSGLQPLVSAKFNGEPVQLIADSGAFYSVISEAAAQQYRLPRQAAPQGLRLMGVTGAADVDLATVYKFTLAGVDIPDTQFLVGGTDIGAAGVLGRNVLGIFDTEYDLGQGAIRLFRPHDCGRADLAYWDKDRPDTVVDMGWSQGNAPETVIPATVDGVSIHAIMDTGAGDSVLTLRAARRLHLDVDGPGAKPAGLAGGFGRRLVRTWLVPVASFTIGNETITNSKLRVADYELDQNDMLLGADFFLSHRVMIANSQHKVYFTYQGGPVFDLSQHPQVAPSDQQEVAGAEPTDAEGYARRGAAFISRGDATRGLADLDKAVAMAPKDAGYLVQRARARVAAGQLFLAMGDLDAALALDPGEVDAHLLRAALRRAGHDGAGAKADLDAAIGAAPPESNLRLAIADQETELQRYGAAIDQYRLWIRYHPEDARLGHAFEGLCFSQAMTGADPDRAVSDCNRAVGLRTNSVRPMAARALVRVRRGEFARAIADDDAALKLTANAPWALYGRGLAELKTGQAQAGRADLDAAAKLYPSIDAQARRAGLAPDAAAAPAATAAPATAAAPS